MFKKVSYLIFALLLFAGAQVFVGCDTSGEDEPYLPITMPAALIGTWNSSGGDSYTIDASEVVYNDSWDLFGFKGAVKKVRGHGGRPSPGYITICSTVADPSGPIAGNYFVIHYILTSSGVTMGGAAFAGDPDGNYGGDGKATQEIAEAVYTVQNGYFDACGNYTK
ncbi:MAG: hypothetical protein FWG35_01530 [Spirochaetaceae bacterium]|nr:hypothetical protein [Spirochaetaceae bacterium]